MKEPEAETRKIRIGQKLKSSLLNWTIIHNDTVKDLSKLTRHAVEEYPTETDPADYALFADGKLLGIIEAILKGVCAGNVIFFQNGLKTENCWIYDCRTNIAGVT